MKKLTVGLFLAMFVSATLAQNEIQNIAIDMGGETYSNHCSGELMEVDEGESIRFLYRLSADEESIHVTNKAVGQIRATGLTTGYEYVGSLMFGPEELSPVPQPRTTIVNIENGRGAGIFTYRAKFTSPKIPEFGTSITHLISRLVFLGGGLDDREPKKVSAVNVCRGKSFP